MWAILFGDECEVTPDREWVDDALARMPYAKSGNQWLCLMRDDGDQMNVLWQSPAYFFEWNNEEMGGALAGYRAGEGLDHRPQERTGFLGNLFGKKAGLTGSGFSQSEATAMLDAYVRGTPAFPDLHWEPL
ncbi:hypothetical protein GCM10010989_05280 [Croceicoccus pelagius]|uniref:Uncharacterized protein n=2 Tax=Croceicoccus pelagius TaxID=1703341 RepID=A0A916Y7Y8_9SPHN|nr:hypothetical protein GCM10010989_05280 [Croceicoccus pelagius]